MTRALCPANEFVESRDETWTARLHFCHLSPAPVALVFCYMGLLTGRCSEEMAEAEGCDKAKPSKRQVHAVYCFSLDSEGKCVKGRSKSLKAWIS